MQQLEFLFVEEKAPAYCNGIMVVVIKQILEKQVKTTELLMKNFSVPAMVSTLNTEMISIPTSPLAVSL